MNGTEDLGGRIVSALLESRKLMEPLIYGSGTLCVHQG